jgi:RecA/RadA recombinase
MTTKKKKLSNTVAKADKNASKRKKKKLQPTLFVPMGTTLVNLAMSGRWDGGAAVGGMYNMPGESSSGKTLMMLSALAEVCLMPDFDDYDLLYDDVEERNNFDLSYMFGDIMEERVKPPHGYDEDGFPIHSETIEDFQDGLHDRFESGKPFIYILDSWDALDCEADRKKFEEQKKARDEDKETSGSYGMAKAKAASDLFRRIKSKIKKSQSMLMIISQTRDNVNGMKAKTRTGGNAIKFYANGEFWLAPARKQAKIYKTVNGIKSQIGIRSRCTFEKNSVSGANREVEFEAYYDYGIDDISANINYLIKHKRWSGGSTINAVDFDIEGSRNTVIKHIEDNDLEEDLAEIVQEVWDSYEEKLRLGRKPRY